MTPIVRASGSRAAGRSRERVLGRPHHGEAQPSSAVRQSSATSCGGHLRRPCVLHERSGDARDRGASRQELEVQLHGLVGCSAIVRREHQSERIDDVLARLTARPTLTDRAGHLDDASDDPAVLVRLIVGDRHTQLLAHGHTIAGGGTFASTTFSSNGRRCPSLAAARRATRIGGPRRGNPRLRGRYGSICVRAPVQELREKLRVPKGWFAFGYQTAALLAPDPLDKVLIELTAGAIAYRVERDAKMRLASIARRPARERASPNWISQGWMQRRGQRPSAWSGRLRVRNSGSARASLLRVCRQLAS